MQAAKGCVFVSLMQPIDNENEFLSVTMWTSRRRAEDYESSGLYDTLLDDSDDFLAEASEWRVHPTGDTVPEVPRLQEPEVEEGPVEIAVEGSRIDAAASPHLFVRIVAVRVQAGRFDELRERYNEVVVPALLETPGCRAVFLVERYPSHPESPVGDCLGQRGKGRPLRDQRGLRQAGLPAQRVLLGLYQWKLSLAQSREREEVSGRDLDVSGYRVITGRRLRG